MPTSNSVAVRARARRIRPLPILAGVAALVLAGCAGQATGSNHGTASVGSPLRGGNLVFARAADIESFDPTVAVDNPSIWADEQIFQTLYKVTADGKSTSPQLATSYRLSADKRIWTFTLRSGVTFSNGTPLTAADVKFSLDRARGSKQGLGYIDSAISSVAAPTTNEVVVTTKYPWAPLLADLSLYVNGIMPADFGGESQSEFFAHPVGTGPFVLGRWSRGQTLKLIRNPHYWQAGKPYLDSVEFTVVPDPNSRLLQLKGNQAQLVDAPPSASVDSLATSSPSARAVSFPSTQTVVLLPNEKYAPMSDVHVRRAISAAVNREAIVQASLFGHGSVANSILPSGVPYHDAKSPAIAYNLAAAKQEMAESAYPDGFSLKFLTSSDYSTVAQIVQQELAPLGIHVTIDTVPTSDLFSEQQNFNYQLSIDVWTMDIPDPAEYASYALDATAGSYCFFTNYESTTMTRLVQAAAKTLDTTARGDLYREIQQLGLQDLPQIPLYYGPLIYGTSTSVHGFSVTPLGNYPLEDVWLAD